MGVTSYGVSMTTLEEVFLRLDNEQEQLGGEINEAVDEATENLIINKTGQNLGASTDMDISKMEGISKEGSFGLLWLQLTALLEVNKFCRTFLTLFCTL